MGLFDFLKKGKNNPVQKANEKPTPKRENTTTPESYAAPTPKQNDVTPQMSRDTILWNERETPKVIPVLTDPFKQALLELQSKNYEVSHAAREKIIQMAENPINADRRAVMWMAEEFEKNDCFKAASDWYLKAMRYGIPEAKEGYRRCYNPYHIDSYFNIDGSRGCGTPYLNMARIDTEKARVDFQKALDVIDNNPSKEDLKRSFTTIYQIASAYGLVLPEAKQWMGDYFETVEKDFVEAAKWFKKASDDGSADGARCFADMLFAGHGIEKDEDEALKYYILAADRGQAEAQFVVGQHYLAEENIDNALKYFRMSSENGYQPATDRIRQIEAGDQWNELPTYQKALENKFVSIVKENRLDSDGVIEFFAPIYCPEDFCKKAYDYCNKQYEGKGQNKLMFEYCMTAFYGCICSVALWNNDSTSFEDADAWDAIYKQINVEFTDSNAERLMGTKQGEDKAEAVFDIISDYIELAKAAMKINDYAEEVCLFAMVIAYKLGMLVAKKELAITNKEFVREYVVLHANDDASHIEELAAKKKSDSKKNSNSIKSPMEFYAECVKDFHDTALKQGVANRGLIFIPELISLGEKIVLDFLKDPFFASEFKNDPRTYYHVIFGLSFYAGIAFATKWHEDFDNLDEYYSYISEAGPADDANALMERYLPKEIAQNQGNAFINTIFERFIVMHDPYWALPDPREYTFRAMVAGYQLGISAILEKFGF